MGRPLALVLILILLILPSGGAQLIGVATKYPTTPVRVPQGRWENIIINLSNWGESSDNQLVTVGEIEVQDENGHPVSVSLQFEIPPVENFNIGWEVVQANWFLPRCEPLITKEPPASLPPELENYYDYYSLYMGDNFWLPAKEVRIGVFVPENVPRGVYILRIPFICRSVKAVEQGMGGVYTSVASPRIQVLGPPPPPPPIPLKLVILIVIIICALIPLLVPLVRKRKIRI